MSPKSKAKARSDQLDKLVGMLDVQRGIGGKIDAVVYEMVTRGGWGVTELGDAVGLSKAEISRRKVRYEQNRRA